MVLKTSKVRLGFSRIHVLCDTLYSDFIGRRWPTGWQFPLLVHERYLHLHLQSHVTWFQTWRVPEETWNAVRSLSIYIYIYISAYYDEWPNIIQSHTSSLKTEIMCTYSTNLIMTTFHLPKPHHLPPLVSAFFIRCNPSPQTKEKIANHTDHTNHQTHHLSDHPSCTIMNGQVIRCDANIRFMGLQMHWAAKSGNTNKRNFAVAWPMTGSVIRGSHHRAEMQKRPKGNKCNLKFSRSDSSKNKKRSMLSEGCLQIYRVFFPNTFVPKSADFHNMEIASGFLSQVLTNMALGKFTNFKWETHLYFHIFFFIQASMWYP